MAEPIYDCPRARRSLQGVNAVLAEMAKAGLTFQQMDEWALDAVYELAFLTGSSPLELVPVVVRSNLLYGDHRG